ncbi:MAG: aminoglycoside phosphotransferase family protein [Chloroflexales bacterium]|nr:aminoglycoside phosphotransferase family protein [Chloroflexales bacterium]
MTTDFAWVAAFLATEAATAPRLAGYYNHNYIVEHEGRPSVVRVPIAGGEVMDVRRLAEADVLRLLEAHAFLAPRLLHRADDGHVSVHSFIAGHVVNDVYPDRSPLPDWVAPQLAAQLARLHAIPPGALADRCVDLAPSPATQQFLHALLRFTAAIYHTWLPCFGSLYQALAIPAQPFAVVEAQVGQLCPRPFVLCHCDVHRKNLILNPETQQLTLLDWEIALVADPAYDLAVHFHKMGYAPEQEETFVRGYLAHSGSAGDVASWQAQIAIYRSLERVKSAIVDGIRYAGDVRRPGVSPAQQQAYGLRYYRKLCAAWQTWGIDPATVGLTPADVGTLLQLVPSADELMR